jgi:hypothetical protein
MRTARLNERLDDHWLEAARKEMEGNKVILPLWHKVSKNEVLRYSPSQADKVALNTATHTLDEVVEQLIPVLKGSSAR